MFCKRDDEKHELFIFAWRWRLWRVRFMIKFTFSASDCNKVTRCMALAHGSVILCIHTKQNDEQLARVDFILFHLPLYTIFVLYTLHSLSFLQCEWLWMRSNVVGCLLYKSSFYCRCGNGFGRHSEAQIIGQLWVEDWRLSQKNLIRNLLWFYCCVAELNRIRAYCTGFVDGTLTISQNRYSPTELRVRSMDHVASRCAK